MDEVTIGTIIEFVTSPTALAWVVAGALWIMHQLRAGRENMMGLIYLAANAAEKR